MVKRSQTKSRIVQRSPGVPYKIPPHLKRPWSYVLLLVPIAIALFVAYSKERPTDYEAEVLHHPMVKLVEMPDKFGLGMVAKRDIPVSSQSI